jgi:hypothetical protein
MTDSGYAIGIDRFWDFNFFKPQANQDSDLLQQLGFIPGLKEILMLRQVHALEHATVWVLSEQSSFSTQEEIDSSSLRDNETLGGLSTERGFYLYGQVKYLDLQRAVRVALQRFQKGEWDLAVHPRCGTNLSVNMLLTMGFVMSAHLLLPKGPIEQLLGLGLATALATQLTPDVGLSAQKYLTTAIPFNLELVDIYPTKDLWGRSAYFVSLRWHELKQNLKF